MVSFTSFVMLSLLALSQAVQGAPTTDAVLSLDKCQEVDGLSKGNTIVNKKLWFAFKGSRYRPIGHYGHGVAVKQETASNDKDITTVEVTNATSASAYKIIRIDWDENLKPVTRFFSLDADHKCRVKHSAGYTDLTGVYLVSRKD